MPATATATEPKALADVAEDARRTVVPIECQ